MRVFEDKDRISDSICLSPENAHHATRVMRLRQGDVLIVCDGQGTDHYCTIAALNGTDVVCKIVESKANCAEMDVRVTVFAGLSKGERFELMLQKCIELGAYEIVPFTSENCVVKLDKKEQEKKVERYNKIARDGAKQSGRGIVPRVCPIVDFKTACAMAMERSLPLFLYECERQRTLRASLDGVSGVDSIAIVSGPEGGFTPREKEVAKAMGLVQVTLGSRILRCETAPIAALAGISSILEK